MAIAVVHDHWMKTSMRLKQLTTIAAIEHFLAGTQAVAFSVATDKKARYNQVQKTLVNTVPVARYLER